MGSMGTALTSVFDAVGALNDGKAFTESDLDRLDYALKLSENCCQHGPAHRRQQADHER